MIELQTTCLTKLQLYFESLLRISGVVEFDEWCEQLIPDENKLIHNIWFNIFTNELSQQ